MHQRILHCTFQLLRAAAPCTVDAPSDKPAQSSYSQGVNHTCARHDEQPAQQQQLRSHLAVEMQRHCWISYIFLLGSCSGSCCLLKENSFFLLKTKTTTTRTTTQMKNCSFPSRFGDFNKQPRCTQLPASPKAKHRQGPAPRLSQRSL